MTTTGATIQVAPAPQPSSRTAPVTDTKKTTTFTIGGQEHEVAPMCLRTTRMAMRTLPNVYLDRDPDKLIDAFLQILEDGTKDELGEVCDTTLIAARVNNTMTGAEMPGLFVSFSEWIKKSGIESGEQTPMAAGLRAMMMQTPPSTASSSPSAAKGSGRGGRSKPSGRSRATKP